MISRIVNSCISTTIIVVLIPIIGFIIDRIVQLLLCFIGKHFGCKFSNFLHNWLTFVGTIHHELAHAIFAIISGAHVKEINLFKPNGDSLGSVVIIPRGNKVLQSFQLTLSAMAPVVMGLITSYLLIFKVLALCNNLLLIPIIIYLIVSILIHSTMSKQDIITWIKGVPLCWIAILIVTVLTNFNIITIWF